MKGLIKMFEFNKNKITILYRDINGKKLTVEFVTEYDVLDWINKGFLDEDDEILLVIQCGVCIYSALGSDRSLNIDELTGFFA